MTPVAHLENPNRHIDRVLSCADNALRTLSGAYTASRNCPAGAKEADATLSPEQRRLSGALMRVNHVGEVCAQALYNAQSLASPDVALRSQFEHAAREETDHLAWTHARLNQLGAHTSLLNPLWYAGAFGIGLLAGALGREVSLGFVVETERQVEQHLQTHLHRLPSEDRASRAIVAQMQADEARHAAEARAAGARELPAPARWAMRAVAKVMTRTALHI
jgi:ubiquinone biosynthesis monooxygenase Coq7